MRTLHSDDERALDFKFDPNDYADERDLLVAQKLGVDIAGPRALAGEIERDMSVPEPSPDAPRDERGHIVATANTPLPDESSFGIGWWSGYTMGTRRRVLVGDYLLETAHAVADNLIEARLHWSAVRAHLLEGGSGMRPETGLRYLDDRQTQLHVAGMLRAVASTSDCLGALAVGVLGLSSEAGGRGEARAYKILFADYGTLERWERNALPRIAGGRARDFQRDAVAAVRAAFQSEPPGWFQWARQYRNTFMHRGRRQQSWHQDIGLRLPRSPECSEMHSLILSGTYPGCLDESAEVTLRGVFVRTESAVTSACGTLLAAWRQRRAEPTLIQQPIEHWPDIGPERSSGFDGFAPRELPHTPTAVVSPSQVHRMLSGAIPWRSRWDSFT